MIWAMFLLVFALCLLVVLFFMRGFGALPSLRTIRLFNKLPGPSYPFYLGPVIELINMELKEIIPWISNHVHTYGSYFAFYAMGRPMVLVADPECVESILTSSKNIDKGPEYDPLKDWLAQGLLMSSGEKWKQRRKMLTPSFHFKILDNNEESMNRNWRKVVRRFLDANGAPVEPLPLMGRGALDIICETAMGMSLDKESGGEEYVATVKRVSENSIKRGMNPFLRNDFVFKNTPFGRSYLKDVKYLHGFTDKVIQERKKGYLEDKEAEAVEYSDSDSKKPQVFLDSLLELSGKVDLNDADIRAEVDTFMFAGHDTTSTALQFILLHLGQNPEVQEKAYQEQLDIFGYSDRDATKEDFSRMHYLDQVIKEGLRLSPPAPQIARQLVEDVKLPDGNILPAGASVLINIFHIHRHPKYFPDPEVFKPERFSLDESKNRHPYSFIPFSAGPRNCIGQKFAMLEMKIGLSTVLRSCRIKTVTKAEDIAYEMTVVLKSATPIRIEVFPRN